MAEAGRGYHTLGGVLLACFVTVCISAPSLAQTTSSWWLWYPTATRKITPTATFTRKPTMTPTPRATATATRTATATATATVTAVPSLTPARSLGSVRLPFGPTPCAGQTCYTVDVSCGQLASPDRATLKVGDPTGTPGRGTILFATGWTGTFYYDQWSADAQRVLGDLRAAGFRTVQLMWHTNWFSGATMRLEGMGRLACRPATVTRWVYDNLYTAGNDTGFCASGDSNGASQIAYGLTQYGLADILDAVELDGGPNWARVDIGCYGNDPANPSMWYVLNEREVADWAFGYPGDTTGPCASRNRSFLSLFQSTSLAYGNWPYAYPHTMVHFLFGDGDTTTTAGHGHYYYNQLNAAGSPLLQIDTVANTPHTVVMTTNGANAIRDVFLNECHPY